MTMYDNHREQGEQEKLPQDDNHDECDKHDNDNNYDDDDNYGDLMIMMITITVRRVRRRSCHQANWERMPEPRLYEPAVVIIFIIIMNIILIKIIMVLIVIIMKVIFFNISPGLSASGDV